MNYDAQIDAALDALPEDATADQIYQATKAFERREVMAAIYERVLAGAGGGGGGSQLVQEQAFSLTAAEIRASTSSPIEVVAAPGADKVILMLGGVYEYTFVTTPYSNGGIDFAIGDNAVGSAASFGSLIDQASSQIMATTAPGAAAAHPRAAMANQPLMLATTLVLTGPILTTSLAGGGNGYVVGDTGTLSGGTGGTYEVLTVDGGGAVLTYSVTNAGDDYVLGATAAFATGGAQPGIGADGSIYVDSVDSDGSGEVGDGTLQGVVYYTIADLS